MSKFPTLSYEKILCVLERQYSKWLKDLRTRYIYMQCTNNLWDCLKEHKWCITRPRLSRTASEPHWSLPDAAEQRALGSSLKDSSCPNEKSLADLLLGKNSILPYCQIVRFQNISYFVPGMKWKHLKGKKERKPASNCWVAAQLDTVVSAPDVTTAKRAPECSRCQFSSMQHKPFQLRICSGLLKLVLLQQNVCTGSMRTPEALEENPLFDLSNKRFRQKVMKMTQGVITAFKYILYNKKVIS